MVFVSEFAAYSPQPSRVTDRSALNKADWQTDALRNDFDYLTS